MALLNYTSKVPAERTISEIQALLSKHNVSAIMTEYDGPHVAALSFKIEVSGKSMGFKLPCNWKSVYEIFTSKAGTRTIYDQKRAQRILDERKEQAIRTSWRIIKDWVEAQLALVEVNMVTVPQVFLPYMLMRDDRTLADHVMTDPKFLLGN